MYNYGMPAALKAWFDQIIRINKTFTFDLARGDFPLEPIMSGKTLVLLTSSSRRVIRSGMHGCCCCRPATNIPMGLAMAAGHWDAISRPMPSRPSTGCLHRKRNRIWACQVPIRSAWMAMTTNNRQKVPLAAAPGLSGKPQNPTICWEPLWPKGNLHEAQ